MTGLPLNLIAMVTDIPCKRGWSPVSYWLIVKNWQEPCWPGIVVGEYATQAEALRVNNDKLLALASHCGGCGYYAFWDGRHGMKYDIGDISCLGARTAFEYGYAVKRGTSRTCCTPY